MSVVILTGVSRNAKTRLSVAHTGDTIRVLHGRPAGLFRVGEHQPSNINGKLHGPSTGPVSSPREGGEHIPREGGEHISHCIGDGFFCERHSERVRAGGDISGLEADMTDYKHFKGVRVATFRRKRQANEMTKINLPKIDLHRVFHD